MNIEIANRLLQLRKNHQFSQEELATKLNISRQAVSKWERAEASPDTDNLIELAKLYGITLDELLTGEKTQAEDQDAGEPAAAEPVPQEAPPDAGATEAEQDYQYDWGTHQPNRHGDWVSFKNGIHVRSVNGDKVDVGFSGVHVEDHNGEKVHVGFDGIHISEGDGSKVHPGDYKHHEYDWDEQYKKQKPYKFWYAFPFPLIALIGFFVVGFCGGWSWSWLLFLTIPLYYTTIAAIQKSNLMVFCYPALAVLIFFLLGFWGNLWHPGWIMFITIPFYYWLASALNPKTKSKPNYFDDNSHDTPNML